MSKRENDELLNEFLDEQDQIKKQSNEKETIVNNEKSLSKPYRCPNCNRALASRKEECKHCGYKGYIPISDDQRKRIRLVLTVVFLIAAIVVLVLTR
jgi:uncharacterized paraquat-inducible protein A